MNASPPTALRRLGRLLWRLLRLVVLLGLVGVIGLAGGLTYLNRTVLADLPEDLSSLRDYRPPTTVRVFDANNELIDAFSLERRIWVEKDTLSPDTVHAFIAAEDRRFYRHHGVDYQGIARALYVNLTAGGVAQGGSTITQQLVKNLLVGSERSYERKLKEAALALRLERELDKNELIELFMNFVYLGAGNYGVEAAAQDFFGIPARDLDPGQSAMLAGLIPSPSRYNPRNNPEIAIERRGIVLRAMAEEGYLSAAEAARYAAEPLRLAERVAAVSGEDRSYVTEVRRELRRLLPASMIYAAGLSVYTGLNRRVQAVAEQAVRDALYAVDARQGRRGAVRRIEGDEAVGRFLSAAPGLSRQVGSGALRFPSAGQCFDALVQSRPPGDTTLLAGPFLFTLRAEDLAVGLRPADLEAEPQPLSAVVAVGDVLRVCAVEGVTVRLDDRPWGEGAAVVLENATGRVVALVGGYEVGIEGFVRATQARRQPGSSFKPYVYGAALMAGARQTDLVVDGPISLPAGNGQMWTPKNYDGGYAGAVPMRTALAKSLNTVAVRLALSAGPETVGRLARAMGVRTPLRRDVTIALGSSEVTPMDQALGYATIARMGVPTDPVYIDRLEGGDGQTLGLAGGPVVYQTEALGQLPGGPLARAMPAGVAYELADMLRDVVVGGTARRAADPRYDRAGKTGTTNDNVDAWFVGFTPQHTIAVWIGSDSTHSLGDKETGGKAALPAWMAIAAALGPVEGARMPIPDDASLVSWHGHWVGRPRGVSAAPAWGSSPLPAFPTAPAPRRR